MSNGSIQPPSRTIETAGAGGSPGRSVDHFERFVEPTSSARLHMGLVVDVCQQRQLHLVRCAGHQFFCPVTTSTGSPLYGARDSVLFPVGSYVVVAHSGEQSRNQAVIIGGYPPASASLKDKKEVAFTLAAELVPGTPIGPYKDKVSSEAFKKTLGVAPDLNKNAGRPIDAYPGDIVHVTELGCGMWAGRAAAVLRAGHDVGVECHYTDSLLRLSGFNFEQFTAGGDLTAFNDEGDYTEIKRLSPYVVESMGGTDSKGQVPSTEGESRKTSKTNTASRVPEETEQIGYWRYLRLTGYLGDLDTTYVSAVSDDAEEPRKGGPDFSDTQDYHGLLKQTIGIDGSYVLQSAKSISLVKDIMIPVPQEVHRPDDPRGDNEEGGFQKDQLERKDVEFEDDKSYSRALSTQDIIAKQANYLSNIAVQEHSKGEDGKDWDLKEVSELKFGSETGTSWESLQAIDRGTFWAELPKTAEIKVDHRTESGKYFVSKSCLALHEDGSIQLEDGYGSQISMRGGSIDISCPGTLTLRSGNDVVSIAGRSLSQIAGENVELAAMKGDARIHADRNVTVLGGNDGRGGVLIESKAEGDHIQPAESLGIEEPTANNNAYNGIWMKARKSTVSMLGRRSYVGCSNDNGVVVLDGNESGNVFIVGDQLNTTTSKLYMVAGDQDDLTSGCHMVFNDNGQGLLRINSSFAFFADSVLGTGSGVGAKMALNISGNLFVEDSVAAGNVTFPVDPGEEFRQQVEEAQSNVEEGLAASSQSLSEFIDALEQSVLRVEGDLKNITFAYPKTEERGLPLESEEPVLPEASWQTRYRSGGSGSQLKFIGVDPAEEIGSSPEASSSITTFWPGSQGFEQAYAEVEFNYINPETGAAVDRAGGDKYNEQIPKLSPTSLSNYIVNSENRTPGS